MIVLEAVRTPSFHIPILYTNELNSEYIAHFQPFSAGKDGALRGFADDNTIPK